MSDHPNGHNHNGHRLGVLTSRTAGGDAAAFRSLFAFMAMPVWGVSLHTLGCPIQALGVVRGTFLEVWHMARHHDGRDDIKEWVAEIARRRADDRRQLTDIGGVPGVFDRLTHAELDCLVGPHPMMARVARRVFVRAEGADGVIAAVADPWPTRYPAAPWRLSGHHRPR